MPELWSSSMAPAAASATKRPQRSGTPLTPLLSTPPSSLASQRQDRDGRKKKATRTLRHASNNEQQRAKQLHDIDCGMQRPQKDRRRALRAIFQDAGGASDAGGDAPAVPGAAISVAGDAGAVTKHSPPRDHQTTEKPSFSRSQSAGSVVAPTSPVLASPTRHGAAESAEKSSLALPLASQDRKRTAATVPTVSLASPSVSTNGDALVIRRRLKRRLHAAASSPALLPPPATAPSLCRYPASEETTGPQTILPTVHSSAHPDLQVVTPDTVARLLRGDFQPDLAGFELLDCRFTYEFQGGSLRGASSLSDPDSMEARFFHFAPSSPDCARRALVFFCEFSATRAPKMLRHMRNLDRRVHADQYPELFFPELYLVLGGYKNCFETLPQQICAQPAAYVAMDDARFVESCRWEFAAWRKRWKPHKTVADCVAKLQNQEHHEPEKNAQEDSRLERLGGRQRRELVSHGVRSLFEQL